ncbi:MAG: hypothetical protein WCW17_03440, partial [Patescibacteria group bacterium]|jgi:hypothetical protein
MSKKNRKIKRKLNSQLQKVVSSSQNSNFEKEVVTQRIEVATAGPISVDTLNVETKKNSSGIKKDMIKLAILCSSIIVILVAVYIIDIKTNLINELAQKIFASLNIFQI